MDNYIVTGFTAGYWNIWGASWFGSLEEHAGFSGNKVVVALDDLPSMAVNKLELYDTFVPQPPKSEEDYRLRTLEVIGIMAKEKVGVYAYFDGDVYFQEEINKLFDLAADKMVVAENLNPGMIAGPSHLWLFFLDFHKAAQMTGNLSLAETLAAFQKHFPTFMSTVPDIWNWTNLPRLRQVGEYWGYSGEVARVVHPSGPVKNFPEAKPYLFSNKYATAYNRWNTIFTKGNRGFLKRVRHVEDVQPNTI